jgi:hypothetical protein
VLLGFGFIVFRRSDYPLSEDLTTPKPKANPVAVVSAVRVSYAGLSDRVAEATLKSVRERSGRGVGAVVTRLTRTDSVPTLAAVADVGTDPRPDGQPAVRKARRAVFPVETVLLAADRVPGISTLA